MHRRRVLVVLALTPALLAGCGARAVPQSQSQPRIVIESPWVRTTDGATNTSMTALFASLTNPSSADIDLVKADCSPVAGMTELHEMVMVKGKSVMQKIPSGTITIPREGHQHLVPGGMHVMLMKLTGPLPIGDEVTCTLDFSNGQHEVVRAPVKKFTEEEDHYHSPAPSANG